MSVIYKTITATLLVCIFLVSRDFVLGQSTLSVATSLPVEGADIQEGMIVSLQSDIVRITEREYDPNIFGVITENPAITVGKKDEQITYPVATNGRVNVLVANINGAIEQGDYITSSSIPGIGMKATEPGRVIGIASENSSGTDSEYDLIDVAVSSEYATAQDLFRVGDLVGNLSDYEESPFGDTDEEPKLLSAVKYISSGIIVVIAFAGGIFYYVQISKKEVEALGRNPLAQKIIQKNMIFHAIVVGLICVGGLIMAYSVLQL